MRIRIHISFSTRIPIFGSGTEIDVLFADLDPDPVMLPPTDLKICFFFPRNYYYKNPVPRMTKRRTLLPD
jgi:hypothetical protein